MSTNDNVSAMEFNMEDKIENMKNKDKIINKDKNIIYRTIKRTIDIIGSIVGLIILIPMTLVVFIANLISKDNGPVFYTHERIGKNGKLFKLYKYRSMVVDADEKLERYLEENKEIKEEYKKYKKLKNDPRITKIGSFIRRTSIDEFPQMINILKGDMSLVGPRPYLPREIEDMKDSYQKIITCKPGLTGYWQVNGRSDTDFEERLQMDKEYIDKRSLGMDIKIFFKTFGKIFRKEGAI